MAGRNKRSLMDVMRTKLWLSEMLRTVGATNIYQLGEMLTVDIKKSLYKFHSGKNAISKKMLVQVDTMVALKIANFEGGANFFYVGPANEDSELVPLWDALEGSMEKVWEVLVRFDPPIALQRYMGVSFEQKMAILLSRLFYAGIPPDDFQSGKNLVAEAYEIDEITVDLELITAMIAAWRFSNFIGESQPLMNYMMIGLLEKAIPDTLEPFGIQAEFNQYLVDIDTKNLQELEMIIKDLNYNAPVRPVTEIVDGKAVFISYKQDDIYDIWKEVLINKSVSKYLQDNYSKTTVKANNLAR